VNEFTELMNECGLSNKGCARLLDVRYDTIKNWKYGKSQTPERVMLQMRQLSKAVDMIFIDN
jgi:DNA-binding transcriptional regulator YiaG